MSSTNDSRRGRRLRISVTLAEGLLIASVLTPVFAQQLPSVTSAEPSSGASEASSASGMQRSAHPSLGNELYAKAHSIFERASEVHYKHDNSDDDDSQVVDSNSQCKALCDCSGLVSYVLQTVAPKHYDALKNSSSRSGHPLASTYERFFASLSTTELTDGWLQVANYKELRRGDLIAWKKPLPPPSPDGASAPHKKGNSGHVMIVESAPSEPQRGSANGQDFLYVNIPVIDSSSVDHFPPEQLPPQAHQAHRDGIGRGTIRLLVSESGQPVGYWEGTYWGEGNKEIKKPTYTNEIAFARAVHNRHRTPSSSSNPSSNPNPNPNPSPSPSPNPSPES